MKNQHTVNSDSPQQLDSSSSDYISSNPPKTKTTAKTNILLPVLISFLVIIIFFGLGRYLVGIKFKDQPKILKQKTSITDTKIKPHTGADLTNEDIKSYFTFVDNFAQFYLTKRGYSPNNDYYLVGIHHGSPIPNRDEVQGNWIIDIKNNSATRIMRDEMNHLFVSTFYDWIGEYKIAFVDQLDKNWAAGKEHDYVIYDIKTRQLTEASRKDVLPPVIEMRSFGNQEYGVEFVAPYRKYPSYRQIVKKGWTNLCEDLNLTRTTDPAITEYTIKSSNEVYLQGVLFDLKVDTSDGSFQIYSHDQDSMLRDACVTEAEYQQVIDSIDVIPTLN